MRRLVADAEMYVIDNDGWYPVDARAFARSILTDADPSAMVGDCGGFAGPVFSYNTRLAGVSRESIRDAAHTVLAYEGRNEHIAYRHGAKAIIAFVDGHVEDLTPNQVSALRWKP
jgi:prepilin-type processing-associated H-X9-DG protein